MLAELKNISAAITIMILEKVDRMRSESIPEVFVKVRTVDSYMTASTETCAFGESRSTPSAMGGSTDSTISRIIRLCMTA